MRWTDKIEGAVVSQDEKGTYWITFTSEAGSERMWLSSSYKESSRRKILDAWAEEQLSRSEQWTKDVP
jgi:hypothetical protein